MPAPDDRSADQARAAIQAALASIGFCLPGSIVIRRTRCGKPACACKADPPALHGPYIQWTRTVKGKTVTRTLTPAQYDAYAPWFASARRLRALAAELEAAVPAGDGPGRRMGQDHPGHPGATPDPPGPGPECPQNTQNAGRSPCLTRDQRPIRHPVTADQQGFVVGP